MLEFHCELHYAARAQARCAESNEVLSILKRRYAAGGLYLKRIRAAAAQQLDIVTGSSALAEAGGGFYEIRAALAAVDI